MRVAKQPERTPITDLQEMLRLINPDTPLSYDGLYGSETERDVRRFQRENGLTETGVVDGDTWEAIRKAYQRQLVLQGQAEPLRIVLQPNQVIGKNSDNLHIFLLQALLLAMKELYLEVPPVKVTGILDAPTERALIWFQERAGLEPSGELDKLTWKYLVHEYRQIIGDGTGSFPVRIQQLPETPEDQRRSTST
jgi:peptidoglycan hydrolase-like protein with peptidoglycan-binding domain